MTDITIDTIRHEVSSAVIADAAAALWNQRATTACATKSIETRVPRRTIAGPAYTIRLTPARRADPEARNAFFHAYQGIPAGSVVVIQVVGDVGGGVLGDVVAHFWKLRGVAGVVVDGPVRDVPAVRDLELPMWSRSVTMRGMKTIESVTECDLEVSIDGVIVRPGDLVVADDDGVFVLPAEEEAEVVPLAWEMLRSEEKTHVELEKGKTMLECYGHPAPPAADGQG